VWPAAAPAGVLGSLGPVRPRWTSKRAVSLHVALVVFVPACVALTWWQLSRALAGNTLSWVYTFEWPIFAAYAVFMWWKLVHEEDVRSAQRMGAGAPSSEPATSAAGSPSAPDPASSESGPDGADEDAELEEYNRYLAELNATGRPKRW
jgi:DNA-binding transcriptional regulator of glucitol operon